MACQHGCVPHLLVHQQHVEQTCTFHFRLAFCHASRDCESIEESAVDRPIVWSHRGASRVPAPSIFLDVSFWFAALSIDMLFEPARLWFYAER